MKLKNNNSAVIRRVAKQISKKNVIRNRFLLGAIILTTFMICVIFTLGSSLYANIDIMNKRMQGSLDTIAISNPSKAQIKKLKKLSYLDTVGVSVCVGEMQSPQMEGKKQSVYTFYLDSVAYEKQVKPCISDCKGSYPKRENEILLSEGALRLLHLNNAKIGSKITIPCRYTTDGNYKEETFVLSGTFAEYIASDTIANGYVSKKFATMHHCTMRNRGTAKIVPTQGMSGKKVVQNIKKSGLMKEYQTISRNFDSVSDGKGASMFFLLLVSFLAVFVVLCAFLLIYNVFGASVNRDIHLYGLMKTVGTSKKQLRQIIHRQAARFCFYGIPIGLLLGFIISFAVVPLCLNVVNSTIKNDTTAIIIFPATVSIHPMIYIGTVLFVCGTVWLSMLKPARMAAKVSPVEAVRYSGTATKYKRKKRKSVHGGRLFCLAFHNVFRDKRRSVVVFLSIFLGFFLFLSFYVLLHIIDFNADIRKEIKYDVRMQCDSMEKSYDEKDISFLKGISGVEYLESSNAVAVSLNPEDSFFKSFLDNDRDVYYANLSYEKYLNQVKKDEKGYCAYLVGITNQVLEKYNKKTKYPVSMKDFEEGKVYISSLPDGMGYEKAEWKHLNDCIELTVNHKKEKAKVVSFARAKELTPLLFAEGRPCIFTSINNVNKLSGNHSLLNYIRLNYSNNVDRNKKNQMIRKYFQNDSMIEITYKEEAIKLFSKIFKTVEVFIAIFSGLLILIGFLNFVNIMISSIVARNKEFAVLESIGMTKKQVKQLIFYEGFHYAWISSMLILTIGSFGLWGLGMGLESYVKEARYCYPFRVVAVILIIIFLFCLFVPKVIYAKMSGGSITERLHQMVD